MDSQIAALNWESPNFMGTYLSLMNQVHQEIDLPELKTELVRAARMLGKAANVESIPVNKIGVEAKIAYFLNRGAKLSQKSRDRLINYITAAGQETENEPVSWEEIPETPQSKHIAAYVNCYSRIDNAKAMVLSGKLSIRELASEVRRIVKEHGQDKIAVVKQLSDHYKDAFIEAKDDNTVSNWVKPLGIITETLWLMVSTHESVQDSGRLAKNRKNKADAHQVDRKGEKAASKVTYKEEDETYGVRSIDPTNLVGSTAAVVFNSKTRHCEVYFAKHGQTLSIQGAKIINFDTLSSTGRTLRKPENDLPHWTRASTTKRLEVLLKGTKGKKWDLTGKLNRNSLIIKVL